MHFIKSICCALTLSTAAWASDGNPSDLNFAALPTFVSHREDVVPAGWKLIATKNGDLNGDTIPDVVVLMRMTGKDNIKHLPASSHYPFDDTNPYLLVIGLARANGYALIHSKIDLFPREVAPVHGDDAPGAKSVDIRRGVLTLNFDHLRGFDRLRFRWDGKAFRLIGYECAGVDGGGTFTSLSANYLTRTAKYTRGSIDSNHQTVSTVKIQLGSRPSMEQFDWLSEWGGKDLQDNDLGC